MNNEKKSQQNAYTHTNRHTGTVISFSPMLSIFDKDFFREKQKQNEILGRNLVRYRYFTHSLIYWFNFFNLIIFSLENKRIYEKHCNFSE